jgi:hypothetical protein
MNDKLKKCFDLIDENMDRCEIIPLKDLRVINEAEKYLDIEIPSSFKAFLKKYGYWSLESQEICGLFNMDFDVPSSSDMVWATSNSRKYGLKNHYVRLGSSGYGPLYVLDCEGKNEVFLWHGDDVYEKLFDSFEDFLMERIEWGLESDEEDEE